ncbi:hypothetical protein AAB988_06755 [Burkholderia contaminans]|uniref:hypothetical protein n=1 Tax=Burkholderia contaminans TaxID=488447 RepID=UPI003114CFC8
MKEVPERNQGAHHKRNRGAVPRRACDPAISRCFGETGCVAVVHGAPGGCNDAA